MTLIEAVTSIVVLGVALPPLTALFREVSAATPDDLHQRTALAYGEALLEEVVSKSFEDPDSTAGSFGTEEAARSQYDDLDDFHGWTRSPPIHLDGALLDDLAGFTRSVVVENVTSLDPDAATPEPGGTTPLKRIRVTVAWTGGRGGELTLSTLRANLSGAGSSGPILVEGSAPTAFNPKDDRLELALINGAGVDLEIESFRLTADRPVDELEEFELAPTRGKFKKIWEGDVDLPTPILALNKGKANERIVPAGGAAGVRFDFDEGLAPGPITFVLELFFTDGSSSTLELEMVWQP